MVLKDFQQTEIQVWIDLMLSVVPKFRHVLCAGLLVVVGTSVFAQSQPDKATDLAKYAMKLPEKQLLRIEANRLPASNRLQSAGLSDGTGSAISGRNSLGAG